MNLLNRNTDYALRAIMYIARQKREFVSTLELNEELGLPRPFMRKIFLSLQQEGILNSVKGNGGGFSLSKPPEKIYLKNVMRIFQGEFNYSDCLFKKKFCPSVRNCPLRREVKRVEGIVAAELDKVTLRKLMGKGKPYEKKNHKNR
ncbi:MAG: Rrf2 family transcriptional regulator [Candidatus Omnitrophica bacterium]|nr:Rrf2 family transcriptional regulator [Candidatus Omnitrophota bacterium]